MTTHDATLLLSTAIQCYLPLSKQTSELVGGRRDKRLCVSARLMRLSPSLSSLTRQPIISLRSANVCTPLNERPARDVDVSYVQVACHQPRRSGVEGAGQSRLGNVYN